MNWNVLLLLACVAVPVDGCLVPFPGAATGARAEQASRAMQALTEADNGRTVDIAVGDTVEITLRENATTGYRWAIDRYDEQIADALGSEPHYQPNKIGAGGTVTFSFRGKTAGSGDIALKNWRHWEGDASVTSRFRIRLNVKP